MAYDIHYEGLAPELTKGSRFLSFGDYEKSLGVQGVQKMVNRYVKCLLTPIGTDLSDKDYGTQLMNLFLGNLDLTAVGQIVSMSVRNAESTIHSYDVDNDASDDERLQGVSVENLDIDRVNKGFTLRLLLQNAEGSEVRVLVPVYPEQATASVTTE